MLVSAILEEVLKLKRVIEAGAATGFDEGGLG